MHPRGIDPPDDGTNRYDRARRQFRRGLARVLRCHHLHRSQFRILRCLPWTVRTHRRDPPTTLGRVHSLYISVLPTRHPVPGWLRTPFIAVVVAPSPLSSSL